MIEFAPRSRLRSYLQQGYHLIPGYEPGQNDYAVLVEKRDACMSETEIDALCNCVNPPAWPKPNRVASRLGYRAREAA